MLGQNFRREKRFVFLLNRELKEPQAVEVLCHGWAHALAWNYSLDRLARVPGIDPAGFDRASNSMRSAEIASQSASQLLTCPRATGEAKAHVPLHQPQVAASRLLPRRAVER